MTPVERTPRTIFIVVTHLLGVGHLARMAALGRTLARAGWRVILASGGRPNRTVDLTGCELVQLPPVHCTGTDFATLLAPDGRPADAAILAERQRVLLAAFDAARPEVLLTELYPFGRRALAAEFEAVLSRAASMSPRPAVLCSIRDVLNPPSRPEKAERAAARLAAWYDGVLVHGDAALVPLEASWPVTPELMRRVSTCGYLHDQPRDSLPAARDDEGNILVSGGGSAAGLPLARAALAAAALLPERRWHLLVGHGVPEPDFTALAAATPPNLRVERARPDFPALLAASALSISQAGYNTVLDLAAAGTRALLVPFSEGGEREQSIRAAELERRGLARVIPAESADGPALAEAARALLAAPRPDWSALALDGAARAAEAISAAAIRAGARAAALDRLRAALARAETAGRVLRFWWRDDDAIRPTTALDALLDRAARHGVPLALATIPARSEPALARRLADQPTVSVLPHGFAHVNHAPAGEKKAEFGAHHPLSERVVEATEGWRRVRDLFGAQAVPVFVPPWNRISDDMVAALPGCGLRGLSTFKRRAARLATPGLVQLNTHLDPIAWRAGGGLSDEAGLYDLLARLIDEELVAPEGTLEPIGLLTHHLVHDGWIDRWVDEVLALLTSSPAVRFVGIGEALAADHSAR